MNSNCDARKSARLTYCVILQCTKCISEGKISKYETPLEIQVVNISSEGLCISTTEVFKEGALLEFDTILEHMLYQSISATIIWSIKKENSYEYGLQITNITGKFSLHINKVSNRFSTSI